MNKTIFPLHQIKLVEFFKHANDSLKRYRLIDSIEVQGSISVF